MLVYSKLLLCAVVATVGFVEADLQTDFHVDKLEQAYNGLTEAVGHGYQSVQHVKDVINKINNDGHNEELTEADTYADEALYYGELAADHAQQGIDFVHKAAEKGEQRAVHVHELEQAKEHAEKSVNNGEQAYIAVHKAVEHIRAYFAEIGEEGNHVAELDSAENKAKQAADYGYKALKNVHEAISHVIALYKHVHVLVEATTSLEQAVEAGYKTVQHVLNAVKHAQQDGSTENKDELAIAVTDAEKAQIYGNDAVEHVRKAINRVYTAADYGEEIVNHTHELGQAALHAQVAAKYGTMAYELVQETVANVKPLIVWELDDAVTKSYETAHHAIKAVTHVQEAINHVKQIAVHYEDQGGDEEVGSE